MTGWMPNEDTPGWNLWNGGEDVDVTDPGNWQDVREPSPFPSQNELERLLGPDLVSQIFGSKQSTAEQQAKVLAQRADFMDRQLAQTDRQAAAALAQGDRHFYDQLQFQRETLATEIEKNQRALDITERKAYAESTGWWVGGAPGARGMAPQRPAAPVVTPQSSPIASSLASMSASSGSRGASAAPATTDFRPGYGPGQPGFSVNIPGRGAMGLGDLQGWATQVTGLVYNPTTGEWSRPQDASPPEAAGPVQLGYREADPESGQLYEFKGGDAGDEASWEPVEEA